MYIFRIFPCLKGVFAPTLHDFVGKQCVLCVQIDRQSPALPWYSKLQERYQPKLNISFNTSKRPCNLSKMLQNIKLNVESYI